MPASTYNSVLTAVQTVVQALGLTYNDVPLAVNVRKLPKVGEILDSCPVLIVCPSPRPEDVEPTAEQNVFVKYRVQVVMAAAGNRDAITNLDTYLNWRQQVRQAFQGPLLAGVSEVFDTDVLPEVVLDRGAMNQNYDYSALGLVFHAIEPRS